MLEHRRDDEAEARLVLPRSCTPDADTVAGTLRDRGWVLEAAALADLEFPEALRDAPPEFVAWATSFTRLSSADDAVWFLSAEDYRDPVPEAFAWNAFEQLSLEAAGSDAHRADIARFWRRHWPVLLAVRGHYAYLAVRDDGVIVHGEEPEFEETTVIAQDLATLLSAVVEGDGTWGFG